MSPVVEEELQDYHMDDDPHDRGGDEEAEDPAKAGVAGLMTHRRMFELAIGVVARGACFNHDESPPAGPPPPDRADGDGWHLPGSRRVGAATAGRPAARGNT